jgi:hypothetical protein
MDRDGASVARPQGSLFVANTLQPGDQNRQERCHRAEHKRRRCGVRDGCAQLIDVGD